MSPSVAALNTLGFAAVPGLGYYLTVSNTLQAMVQLLEGTKMFRVLSRPSVYTANNKKAVIRSGREVAVPSSTVSNLNAGTNDNAAVTSNIDFKTIELKLEVVPLINANRQVTLEIAQKNDSQTGTTNITGIEVPEIQTQRVNTTVTVNDQSTVVLGGLITDDTRVTEQGIPWVSQIPLIGYLFKSEDRTKERHELVVMIQPTVIAETDDASKESNAEAAKYDVAPGSRHILEEGTTENNLRGEKMLKDREKKLNLDKTGESKDGKPVPKAAPISEADAAKVTLPPVKGG
jgi:general secretion pathway protein D